jgi:hypothetical protein
MTRRSYAEVLTRARPARLDPERERGALLDDLDIAELAIVEVLTTASRIARDTSDHVLAWHTVAEILDHIEKAAPDPIWHAIAGTPSPDDAYRARSRSARFNYISRRLDRLAKLDLVTCSSRDDDPRRGERVYRLNGIRP